MAYFSNTTIEALIRKDTKKDEKMRTTDETVRSDEEAERTQVAQHKKSVEKLDEEPRKKIIILQAINSQEE